MLQEANEALYEVLFTLAQDDWPQVSSHCQAWLACWLPNHQGLSKVSKQDFGGYTRVLLLGKLPFVVL